MRRSEPTRLALAVFVLATPAGAEAGGVLPPWLDTRDVPLPSGARSVHIARADEPLFVEPAAGSARRGTAALGALLPIYASSRGSGCASRWLMVGALAWVCEAVVQLSSLPPLAAERGSTLPDGLPHRYYFVGPEGSLGYRSLPLAEEGVPDAEFEPGFALAVTTIADKARGDPFGLTTRGFWVPLRDLSLAHVSSFRGVVVGAEQQFGFVLARHAPVYRAPGGRIRPGEGHTRRATLPVLETRKHLGKAWYRVGDEAWMAGRDLRVAEPAALPAGVHEHERWLDVDIQRQVLTAFVGAKPVFSTLISTGKGRGKSEQATPLGEHRIWVKLQSTDMDNLEDEDAGRYYAMQAVPWVMFFKKGYGLHGTYWHDSFGTVRSHGCVNLSTHDAQRLFEWTSPRLPAGWTAVFPTPYEAGTLVRVR
jgi:hypothetical protein